MSSIPDFGAKPAMKTEYKKVPEGTHLARVWRVVDLGDHMNDYGTVNKIIHVTFELPNITMDIMDRQNNNSKITVPMSVSNRFGYKYNMNKRAKLRKDVESILNKKLTDNEAAQFNPLFMINKLCMVEVIHKVVGDNIFENIKAVVAAPEGTLTPDFYNKPTYYIPSHPQMFNQLPEWMQKKINDGVNESQFDDDPWADKDQAQASDDANGSFDPPGTEFGGVKAEGNPFDDDIPF